MTIFWEWGDGQTKNGLPGVHQYAAAGNYLVRMIATSNSNGCKDTADIPVIVDHLGVNSRSLLSSISVHPNPVSKGEAMEFNGIESGKVRWVNVQGMTVAEQTIFGSVAQVPSHLTPGMYFLQMTDKQQQFAPVKVFVK
jgi:PKD repeat protein